MDSMDISLVTSQVQIFAKKATGMTVGELIEKVEETVDGTRFDLVEKTSPV